MKSFLLLVLFGVALFAERAMSEEFTTSGDGGELCGGRRCNAEIASCDPVTNTCKCNMTLFDDGDGRINCYRNNTFQSEITNDPNMLTFNENKIALQMPCRYFWTHTLNQLKNQKREPVGTCEFKAFAFHHKFRGKFYVGGFDVAIRVIHDNNTEKDLSFRIYGKAYGGSYKFIANTTDNKFLPHGPWNDENAEYYDPNTNLRIEISIDAVNNLIILDMKKCGMRFQFRPYDCKLRLAQPLVPHAAVGVNCAFKPDFLSKDKVVGLPPAAQHGGQTIDEILIPGFPLGFPLQEHRELTLLRRAFRSKAYQNSPEANPECSLTGNKLDECNDTQLVTALINCRFILNLPRFINCYDDTESGIPIMKLYNRCIDVYCSGFNCQSVINNIKDSKCHEINNPYTEVTEFVSGAKCP